MRICVQVATPLYEGHLLNRSYSSSFLKQQFDREKAISRDDLPIFKAKEAKKIRLCSISIGVYLPLVWFLIGVGTSFSQLPSVVNFFPERSNIRSYRRTKNTLRYI